MTVDARWVVSTVVLTGYLLAARGVGSLYPISTFPMFSGAAGETVSRVMARTAAGELVEVGDLTSWKCDNLPHLDTVGCAGAPGIAYVDREREAHIRSHPGDGGEPVELVRRVFSFAAGAHSADCPIARCTAKRK